MAAGVNLSCVAAGLLICCHGMLRGGELCHLQVGDVTFYHQHVVLRLGLTNLKAGKRTGQEEMVVSSSKLAVHWLRPAENASPMSCSSSWAGSFSKMLQSFAGRFLLPLSDSMFIRCAVVAQPGFLSRQSMERALLQGAARSSTSSARVYLQDAVAVVAHLKLQYNQVALAHAAAKLLRNGEGQRGKVR